MRFRNHYYFGAFPLGHLESTKNQHESQAPSQQKSVFQRQNSLQHQTSSFSIYFKIIRMTLKNQKTSLLRRKHIEKGSAESQVTSLSIMRKVSGNFNHIIRHYIKEHKYVLLKYKPSQMNHLQEGKTHQIHN